MNKIALLIPHFNNVSGLILSLASIDLSEKIDVVIVDDGSTIDKINEQEVRAAYRAMGTVIILYLKENQGIEHALNHGLSYILEKGYRFTSRLDAGDTCIGKRFELQLQYLLSNPNIKLLGTNADAYDLSGKFLYKYNFPETYQEIKRKIYINAVFVHPSIMFDNEIIKTVGLYPTNYKAAEDFGFTMKIVKNFEAVNMPESLIKVEINPEGISLSMRKLQTKSRINIIKDNFYFGFYPIYGLFRSWLLYIIPDKMLFYLKAKKIRSK